MRTVEKVTHVGLDCHKKFSTLSGRDAAGVVVLRERVEHADRSELRRRLGQYAPGTPVVLEGTFGWGWMSDELSAAALEPHLASGSKLAGWRKSRNLAKNNKLDADLLSEVWDQKPQGTRQFRKEVKSSAAARRLMTLPGVSWILAYTILAEVGGIERFKNARKLCRYSCLAPLADDSGEDDDGPPIGRHVGHAGRRALKWAWIEAAHGAVRHGGRFKQIFDRRTNGGKRDRNRGYIAVAHELCRLAYVLWTKEVDYSDSPPPRPGSRTEPSGGSTPGSPGPIVSQDNTTTESEDSTRRTPTSTPKAKASNARIESDDSRSGTGQPGRAMAAAGL